MYCSNCGKENKENAEFCEFCGAPIEEAKITSDGMPDIGMPEKERRSLFWAYWGILLLIPISKVKNKNEYYLFHMNQGANAWILSIITSLLPKLINSDLISLICGILNLLLLVWITQGMIDNKNHKMVKRGLLSIFQIFK